MSTYKLCYRLFFLLLLLPFSSLGKNDNIDSLKSQLNIVDEDTAKVLIMVEIADAGEKDCNKQITYAKRALKLAEDLNYVKGIVKAKEQIGEYYMVCKKDFAYLIPFYKNLLTYSKQNNSTYGAWISYMGLSECYESEAVYDSIIYFLNQAVLLDVDDDKKIQARGNLGVYNKTVGNYTAAIENYQKAYNLLYQDMSTNPEVDYNDTLNLMGLQYEIGTIYKHTQDYDRALEQLEHVNEMNKTIDFSWFHVLVNMEMGDCYSSKGDHNKAISYYKLSEKAVGIQPYQQSEVDLAQIYIRLSITYYDLKEIDTAYKYAIKAQKIIEGRNGNPPITSLFSKAYKTLGDVYTSKNEYAKAESILRKAVKYSADAGASDQESEALKSLSETYKKMGRSKDALIAYEKHIAIKDSLYSQSKMQQLTRIDMQGSFDRQQFTDSMKQAKEMAASALKLQRQRLLTYSGLIGVVLLLLLSFVIFRNYTREKKAKTIISEARDAINEEKQVSEKLLLNILPEEVADELKRKGNVDAHLFDNVTVLFTDFIDFTSIGERLSPNELVAELHTCFKAFDEIIDKYDIEKIKTVGDAYLAVSGLPQPNENHATDVVSAALEIADFLNKRKLEIGENAFIARIGVNTGSVVAGIVGVKKFAYDIWGDTVNTAARMEQAGTAGKVNISEHTYQLVKDKFNCTYRGELEAKNKGKMKMYYADKA